MTSNHAPRGRIAFCTAALLAVVLAAAPARADSGDSPPEGSFVRSTRVSLPREVVAYRTYGGDASSRGNWYAFTPPRWNEGVRNDYALPPRNAATQYDEVVIRARTPLWVGTTAAQEYRGDSRDRRPGGAPQIWVSSADIAAGAVDVRRRALPVPQGDIPREAARFASDASEYISSNATWRSYAEQRAANSRAAAFERNVAATYSTSPATVQQTVRSHGSFPGGVLLEATAKVPGGLRAVRLVLDDPARAAFVLNDTARFGTDLSKEEVAILAYSVAHDGDSAVFGAVAQDRFVGVADDTVVAKWLGLADSEFGAYAYGYDVGLNLFDPELPSWKNPEVLRLDRVADGDWGAITQDIDQHTTGFRPRLYLKSEDVTFEIRGDRVDVAWRPQVFFQVFREAGASEADIEFDPRGADVADPEHSASARWFADNLETVARRSPAWQRVLQYDAVLALLRRARTLGLRLEGDADLPDAYEKRSRLKVIWDTYAGGETDLAGHHRLAALRLEDALEHGGGAMTAEQRLLLLIEIVAQAAEGSDAEALASARPRLVSAASQIGPSSDLAELARWASGGAIDWVANRIAAPFSAAEQQLTRGRPTSAGPLFARAAAACDDALRGVDAAASRSVCDRIKARLDEMVRLAPHSDSGGSPFSGSSFAVVVGSVVLAAAAYWVATKRGLRALG